MVWSPERSPWLAKNGRRAAEKLEISFHGSAAFRRFVNMVYSKDIFSVDTIEKILLSTFIVLLSSTYSCSSEFNIEALFFVRLLYFSDQSFSQLHSGSWPPAFQAPWHPEWAMVLPQPCLPTSSWSLPPCHQVLHMEHRAPWAPWVLCRPMPLLPRRPCLLCRHLWPMLHPWHSLRTPHKSSLWPMLHPWHKSSLWPMLHPWHRRHQWHMLHPWHRRHQWHMLHQ